MVSPVLAALQQAVAGGAAPTNIPNPNPNFRSPYIGTPHGNPPHPFPADPSFDPNIYAVEYSRALAPPSRLTRLNQALAGQTKPVNKTGFTRLMFNDPAEAYDFQQGLINASTLSGKPWKGKTPEVVAIPKMFFGPGGTGSAVGYVSA